MDKWLTKVITPNLWRWIVICIIIVGIVCGLIYFVLAKRSGIALPSVPTHEQTNKNQIGDSSKLVTYHSQELGISFQYPTDFKVYQQDENSILIKTTYSKPGNVNPQISNLSIVSVSIKKVYSPETKDQFKSRLLANYREYAPESVPQVIDLGTKNNYQILHVREKQQTQEYFLSDKGTFFIDDSISGYLDELDFLEARGISKTTYEKEEVLQVYQEYRKKINLIKDSIVFD